MPLRIVRNDITKMSCDAIVNAAKPTLLGGGGVDGAIHKAAGPGLLDACRRLGGCRTGEAKITRGYELPCKYIIHTVGPVWRGGTQNEEQLLRSCYRSCLKLAEEYGCESAAFPLISTGAYGFPKREAFRIAMDTVTDFLMHSDMTVYLVVFGRESLDIGQKLFAEIQEFIDDNYVESHTDYLRERWRTENIPQPFGAFDGPEEKNEYALPHAVMPEEEHEEIPALPCQAQAAPKAKPKALRRPKPMGRSFGLPGMTRELEKIELDESFQQMLLRKIDESGMTDAECYKKSNIDRKLFSKIRKDVHYRPSKPTAIAFAIALELNLEETNELLKKAGFALSHSFKFDVIIEYFIRHGNYNIYEINEALFAFDQSLLGG